MQRVTNPSFQVYKLAMPTVFPSSCYAGIKQSCPLLNVTVDTNHEAHPSETIKVKYRYKKHAYLTCFGYVTSCVRFSYRVRAAPLWAFGIIGNKFSLQTYNLTCLDITKHIYTYKVVSENLCALGLLPCSCWPTSRMFTFGWRRSSATSRCRRHSA